MKTLHLVLNLGIYDKEKNTNEEKRTDENMEIAYCLSQQEADIHLCYMLSYIIVWSVRLHGRIIHELY